MPIEFKVVNDFESLSQCFCVRAMVFCDGQGIPFRLERDSHDFDACHVLGSVDDEPVATARFRMVVDSVKIERVAVRTAYRGNGYGKQLMDFICETINSRGYSQVKLHAQSPLKDYYQSLGFQPQGQPFTEANIQHIKMVKRL